VRRTTVTVKAGSAEVRNWSMGVRSWACVRFQTRQPRTGPGHTAGSSEQIRVVSTWGRVRRRGTYEGTTFWQDRGG